MSKAKDDGKGHDWLEAELADTIDEDYELELSEPALSTEIRKVYRKAHPATIARAEYFRALLRLQAELIGPAIDRVQLDVDSLISAVRRCHATGPVSGRPARMASRS